MSLIISEESEYSYDIEAVSILADIASRTVSDEQFAKDTAIVVQSAVQYVLDGEEHIDNLEGCEKTQLGTKVEKRWLKRYGFPIKRTAPARKRILERTGETYQNPALDTVIGSVDVDIKHTIGDNWMIPREAVNRWCLLFRTDYTHQTYDLGLLKMADAHLTEGCNQDKKRSVSAEGKKHIYWIVRNYSLPEAGKIM